MANKNWLWIIIIVLGILFFFKSCFPQEQIQTAQSVIPTAISDCNWEKQYWGGYLCSCEIEEKDGTTYCGGMRHPQ